MPRKKAENPTQRLTVYLLVEGVTDFEDALAEGQSPKEMAVAPDSGFDGRFFYEPRAPRRPAWVPFVRPALTGDLEGVFSASSAGLLLLRTDGRMFALTFGFGKSLLEISRVERRFGLKVTLNRIDPKHIRSMDTKTFEDLVVTKRTQTSRSSELPSFGVDVSRDILRAATGKPLDPAFAKQLSGADALVMNVAIPVTDLGSKCSELLAAFHETRYRENFAWIDHLAIVDDPVLVARLNDVLVAELRTGVPVSTHMAVPETVEWDEIEDFSVKIRGTRAVEYDDLDLEEYLAELGDSATQLTVDLLRSRRVGVRYSRSGGYDFRWSVYGCLVCEQRIDDALYVLIEGQWFAVDESLVKRVRDFVGQLPASSAQLPSGQKGEWEKKYNERAAAANPSELLLLDAKIRRPGGASSGIEACDLLTTHGEFIHIKRKSSSATLSHLFSQGSVSAQTLLDDSVFRAELEGLIRTAAGPRSPDPWLSAIPASVDAGTAQSITVSYVVITNSTKGGSDWLPFFSQLNLMQHGRLLRNAGFRLTLSRVLIGGSGG